MAITAYSTQTDQSVRGFRSPPSEAAERRLEAEFWDDFQVARPKILGALLDAVSLAIRGEASVTMPSWPRMADFARWVTAAEPALGWADGRFLAAYYANRGSAHEMALEADPIAIAVRDLLAEVADWEGRPTDLLAKLASIAGDQAAKRKDWPGAANTLSNRLERLAPNLRAVGIDIERTRSGGRRTIRLSRLHNADRERQGSTGKEGMSSRREPSSSSSRPSHTRSDGAGDRAGQSPPGGQPSSSGPPASSPIAAATERGDDDGDGDDGQAREPSDLTDAALTVFGDLLKPTGTPVA